ncbi:hypothetical protein FQN54_007052 [Arachnomyces sp. PD_36]|nr:hypothetical protein FQN54_007052 [Arachnomyces sp. PD_36]
MTSKLIPSNPSEVMVIRKLLPDIVTMSTPFARFGYLKFGGRGTIVRMQSGALSVFSPVALTPEVKTTVESLGGNVKYIAAPDMEHHIFLTPWKEAYPNAEIIAPEGLREKREQNPETKGLDFAHIFTTQKNKEAIKVSEEFDAEFETEYVHSHPSKDLVFLHKPSKTLIEADMLFNLPATEQYSKTGVAADSGFLTRMIMPLQSTKAPATWHQRFLWYIISAKDQKGFAESAKRIDKWDFDRLIPCHGDVIETGAKDVFRRVFAWYLDGAHKKSD